MQGPDIQKGCKHHLSAILSCSVLFSVSGSLIHEQTVHSQLAMATAEQVPDKLSEGHCEELPEMPTPLPLPGPFLLVDAEAFPLLTA